MCVFPSAETHLEDRSHNLMHAEIFGEPYFAEVRHGAVLELNL